jgi:ketosteroid isomerase-like protein
MMTPVLLAIALVQSPSPAADTTGLAAEVDRGVQAFNARDLKYYEASLADDAVFIADDGGMFIGKERVMRHFTRVFGQEPPRRVAVTDVTTGQKGDVGWARFKWTLSAGTETGRSGVATTLFTRAGGRWQVLQIQNTLAGHRMASPRPSP